MNGYRGSNALAWLQGNVTRRNTEDIEDVANYNNYYNIKDMLINNLNAVNSIVGYQGNNSIYATIPVSLNGMYDVEFYYKTPSLGALRRIVDFRDGGGTGFISITASNSTGQSSGTAYVDRIYNNLISDTNLHLVEIRGMSIVATAMRFMTATGGTLGACDAFVSQLRIYNHLTGDLVYEWLLNETTGTALVENTGLGSDGTIYNTYAGLFATVSASIIFSYRYLAWRISRISKTDCLITHDDGYNEMLSIVAPLLQQNGMVANIGVVKDWIDKEFSYIMTLDQCKTLKDTYGFGIVSHTFSHQNLATLIISDPIAASNEVTLNQTWLNANGLDGDYFIFAQSNSYSPKAKALLRSLNTKVARLATITGLQSFPPEDPLSIISINTNVLTTDSDVDAVLYLLDQAVATKSIIITYNHNVKSDADALAESYVNVVGLTNYTKMITRLKHLNVETYTMKNWYKKYYV